MIGFRSKNADRVDAPAGLVASAFTAFMAVMSSSYAQTKGDDAAKQPFSTHSINTSTAVSTPGGKASTPGVRASPATHPKPAIAHRRTSATLIAAGTPCQTSAAPPAANALGAYVGVVGDDNAAAQYQSFVSAMGSAPKMLNGYVDPRFGESEWVGNAQWSAGKMISASYARPGNIIPVLGIPMAANGEDAGTSFRNIASGSEDAVFNGIFAAYANKGYKTIYIRPGWEMNGDWYPWSVTSANAADFVAAFRRIADLAHNFPGATIKVIWNPAFRGFVDYNSIYPADQYVDMIGLDTYGVDAGGTPDSSVFDESSGPTDFSLKSALAMAIENGKPLALPEVGAGTNDTTFPANVATVIAASSAQIAFVTLWDDPSGGNSSLYWSETPSTAAAWKKAFTAIARLSGCSPSTP